MTLSQSDLLNLPDAPDFISHPPEYSLVEMIELCEKMLPEWNIRRYSTPEPPFVGQAFLLDCIKTELPASIPEDKIAHDKTD